MDAGFVPWQNVGILWSLSLFPIHRTDFSPVYWHAACHFFWNWDILHFYPVWHPNEMYIPLDFSHTTIFFHSAGSNSFYRQLQPNNSIQFPDSGKEVFYPTINNGNCTPMIFHGNIPQVQQQSAIRRQEFARVWNPLDRPDYIIL